MESAGQLNNRWHYSLCEYYFIYVLARKAAKPTLYMIITLL